MLDRAFLLGDYPFDKVADGDDPDNLFALHDGQVAYAAPRHDGHAFVDGVLRSHEDDRAGHDLRDRCVFRGATLEDDFAGIVALGNYADQLGLGE